MVNSEVQVMNMNLDDRVELVPGHVYRKTIGTDCMGITMFWMTRPDDPEVSLIPFHSHGEEMFYCLKGKGTIKVDGVPHVIQEGDTMLIPAGAEHGGVFETDELIILCVESPPRPELRFYFNDITKEGAPLIPPGASMG